MHSLFTREFNRHIVGDKISSGVETTCSIEL
jgi:hypothetical protein